MSLERLITVFLESYFLEYDRSASELREFADMLGRMQELANRVANEEDER